MMCLFHQMEQMTQNMRWMAQNMNQVEQQMGQMEGYMKKCIHETKHEVSFSIISCNISLSYDLILGHSQFILNCTSCKTNMPYIVLK